uniref:PPFIA binding protein 2 n=1 Tax=Catagonus wagneri TaxID=51154 RepID=A0A8C3VVD2_9CETA
MLQQELLSRTSLETQKLDLLTEVSELKLKLVGMEKEQREQEEKQKKAESVLDVISELQEQMLRLQLAIHRQMQERLALSSEHPAEVVAGDGAAQPQPCSRDCAGWEGPPELLQELRHLRIKVEELENERHQYEWKLKATKAEVAQLQEQVALKDAEI